MQLPNDDLLAIALMRELRRTWLKWLLASVLTLVGSATGAAWAAGQYLAEVRARAAHAEYLAEDARSCCLRQTERIDSLKEK